MLLKWGEGEGCFWNFEKLEGGWGGVPKIEGGGVFEMEGWSLPWYELCIERDRKRENVLYTYIH